MNPEDRIRDLEIEVTKLEGIINLQRQMVDQLKERLDHSSATGHKAWEAFQRMESTLTALTLTTKNQGKDLEVVRGVALDSKDLAKGAHEKHDNWNKGLLYAALVGFLLLVARWIISLT